MTADTEPVRYEVEPSPLPEAPWQSVAVYADGTRKVGGRYASKAAASRFVNQANRLLHIDASPA